MTRVLVCGGRDFQDDDLLWNALNRLASDATTVITGDARGADRLANNWARAGGGNLETYPADWRRHGRAAGAIRNQQMLDDGKPDRVIAFPGGRGTADMIRRARAAGIEVIEVNPTTALGVGGE